MAPLPYGKKLMNWRISNLVCELAISTRNFTTYYRLQYCRVLSSPKTKYWVTVLNTKNDFLIEVRLWKCRTVDSIQVYICVYIYLLSIIKRRLKVDLYERSVSWSNLSTVVFQDKAARLVALFQKKRPYSGQAGIWPLDPKTLVG